MKAAGRGRTHGTTKRSAKSEGNAGGKSNPSIASRTSPKTSPRGGRGKRDKRKADAETAQLNSADEEHVERDEALDENLHNIDHLLHSAFQPEATRRSRRSVTMNKLEKTNEMTFITLYQANVDIFQRWILWLSRGLSGQTKLLFYNLQSLVRYGGFLTMTLDGTLATMDKAQWVFLCALVGFYGLVFIGVTSLINSGQEMETRALEEMTRAMNQFVPFVLGLYIALSLNRWWTIRYRGLSEVMNSACNVVMVVSCVLPSDSERHRSVRVLVMKWSFASVFLLVKAVREQPSLNDMLFKGLLNDDEVAILKDVHDLYGRPSIVWGWVLRIVNESFAEAAGPMPHSIQVSKVCEIILQASNGLSCIDNHLSTQLPFVYVHLIALLVDVNSFFLVLKTSVLSAVAYESSDWQRLISEVICCLVVPMLYRGLLSISYVVYDPFGDDILDFPIGSYMDWNAQCCHALFKAQERFPGVPGDVYAMERREVRKAMCEPTPTLNKADRLREIKQRMRRILISSHRNGKLEEAVRKVQEITHEEEQADKIMASMNVGKISAGMKAASIAAAPLANEIKHFCQKFKNELVHLQQSVVLLRDVIESDGSKQHDNFEAVCSNLFTDWGVYT